MSSQLLEKIKKAGVVGAGGGGFPSWAKLKPGAEVIIVNGAECEPLLKVDQQLMSRHAGEIAQTLKEIIDALGIPKGVIALKQKYKEARLALQAAIEHKPGLSLHILDDIYPAGDEHILVHAVTGRVIPPGQLPMSVGAIVLNVETVLNIARALDDKPVTHKYVTVTGAVGRPQTLRVPMGITAGEMIRLSGGPTCKEYTAISGGPCMGKIIRESEPVIKTTKGILVLPDAHPLIRMYRQDLAVSLKRAMAVCSQCQQCTDLCPRHLLGHPIRPHMVMRAAAYNISDAGAVRQALLCSECGVCDLYACPAGLSPRAVNRAIKKELLQKGVKIQNTETGSGVQEHREWRQIPSKRLLIRLGLEGYSAETLFSEDVIKVKEVRLPLKQGAGAPAEPLVHPGDKVKAGQQIAAVPEGALGSHLHAGISGTITAVSPEIVIQGSRGGANNNA